LETITFLSAQDASELLILLGNAFVKKKEYIVIRWYCILYYIVYYY